MSADEIRRLAEDCHKKSWCYGLDTIEHRIEKNKEQALLAYATMVERGEKIKVERPFDSVINTANYILRGNAGKGNNK